MATDDVRLTRLEDRLDGLREDMGELKHETLRTRKRLHDLEGLAGTLVDQEKVRRELTRKQQEAFKLRLQVLTVVVAVAALAEPFLYHVAIGG